MSAETNRAQAFQALAAKMAEMFELDVAAIRPDANLFRDLELDSIDAIDLAVQLEKFTGHRVEEDALRAVRTVDDVVDLLVTLQASPSP